MSHGKALGLQPSRLELIEWINATLHINLTAIEELGSGAVFCQLLNHGHPGAIPSHRINFQGVTAYDFLSNFKLLQSGFAQVGIDRPLDLQALAKAQYKDNFELAVWFHGYLGSQLVETDCTLSSQGQPLFDFSFARRTITPKYFTPRRCPQDGSCTCSACTERGERRLRQRLRELQTKFQMIGEVLTSGEQPQEMFFLIQEIIDLTPV